MCRMRMLPLIALTLLLVSSSGFGGQRDGRFVIVRRYNYVPQPPQLSVKIGNFYLRKGDYRGALSRFREAVRTDPDYAPAYLGLGKAYDRDGQYPKALQAYEKYLDELPSDRDAEKAKGVHDAIAKLKRRLASKGHATAFSTPPHVQISR
ncbi:MAG: tetratricopeptide repeat protein [Terriglobia bacterium]